MLRSILTCVTLIQLDVLGAASPRAGEDELQTVTVCPPDANQLAVFTQRFLADENPGVPMREIVRLPLVTPRYWGWFPPHLLIDNRPIIEHLGGQLRHRDLGETNLFRVSMLDWVFHLADARAARTGHHRLLSVTGEAFFIGDFPLPKPFCRVLDSLFGRQPRRPSWRPTPESHTLGVL